MNGGNIGYYSVTFEASSYLYIIWANSLAFRQHQFISHLAFFFFFLLCSSELQIIYEKEVDRKDGRRLTFEDCSFIAFCHISFMALLIVLMRVWNDVCGSVCMLSVHVLSAIQNTSITEPKWNPNAFNNMFFFSFQLPTYGVVIFSRILLYWCCCSVAARKSPYRKVPRSQFRYVECERGSFARAGWRGKVYRPPTKISSSFFRSALFSCVHDGVDNI